jgi:uncharacterized protein (DUF1330 family)
VQKRRLLPTAILQVTAYAIGLLGDVQFGPDIVNYLERIDATLEPFGGAFLVHGTRPEMKEGVFAGDCVVIGFPTIEQARAWYASDVYAELIPLRTRHSQSTVFLLDGVEAGYRAVSLLDKLGAGT